uniref:SCP domain-containing protein n=1 Tax=Strongyloides venezuelensis TaxID=75913 RepID=A0A0K0FJB2_STRVS
MKYLLTVKLYIINFILLPCIQGVRLGAIVDLFTICYRRPYISLDEDIEVTYYLYNYKVMYECNGFFFNQHKYVVNYYRRLLSGKDRNRKRKPNGALDCKHLNHHVPLYKIAECKYPDMLKSNPFSSVIYENIWLGCDYNCFAARNFQILKQGYVTEINQYRRLHDTPPLILDRYLEILANEKAKRSCSRRRSSLIINLSIGYLLEIFSLESADHLISKMYDRFLTNYNWHAKRHEGKYDKYAQMLWSGTKKVGVGVFLRNDKICVALLFSPRGCTRNFRMNVRPIGSKHIHMFAVFGKKYEMRREK